MNLDGPDPWQAADTLGRAGVDAGPLGLLPSLTRRQVRLMRRLGPDGPRLGPDSILAGLAEVLGGGVVADRFEVHWRGSGLRRPGAVAQLAWPRLSARVGLGIEPALAHAVVDRLLGYERTAAEGRLQITPVEWGILSFVIARGLDRLDRTPGPLGPWDLTLDRVGPDPFDPEGLGPIVTWRWRVRVGPTAASARLWFPESILAAWLNDEPPASDPGTSPGPLGRFADLGSDWRAEAGTVSLPRGLGRLRPSALLLIDGAPLRGTPRSPEGPVDLAQSDGGSRSWFRARPAPDSAAARLILETPLRRILTPRETPTLATSADPATTPGGAVAVAAGDIPVTLTVELGRVNLPLARLAELKPGDVLELGRHAREPVDLTSGGRLVARGELVQVDTELGVRVTQVFL